jgi:hypothetical protein
MIQMEFVSTECLRPEVCLTSWQSFQHRLKGINWANSTLYLNVDCAPTDLPNRHEIAEEVIDAAGKVFGRVEVRVSEHPNFTRAVKWGWRQPKGPYFFYLQADWLLTCDVDVQVLIDTLNMGMYKAVNLKAYPGQFTNRLCLSPVLIDSEVAWGLASEMNDDVGPEAQLRASHVCAGGRNLGEGILSAHWPPQRDKIVLKDIGRDWMKSERLAKKDGTPFVTWERQ